MTVLTKKKLKPMMSVDDMIINLKDKNIKFNYISEDDAKDYLVFDNSYYNVLSYEGNFERYYINGVLLIGMLIQILLI